MANDIVLGTLELGAMLSCGYGIYSVYGLSSDGWTVLHISMWFLLGFVSNMLGLLSIGMFVMDSEEESTSGIETMKRLLHFHFLLAWLTVIVGYPSLVNQLWQLYHPIPLSYIVVVLSSIPLLAWLKTHDKAIVLSTQIVTGVIIVAHLYVSYLAMNIYSVVAAIIMIWIIISMSLPTKYTFLGISSRESFIVALALNSAVLSIVIPQMVLDSPQTLPAAKNWIKS